MINSDDCQSYLSHLQSEHHRLELLTTNIVDRFTHCDNKSWGRVDRPEIAARLSALKDELAKHIEQESRGGCVDEAVSRMPSLSSFAQKIFHENDELRERLRNVMRLVDEGSRVEAESAFRSFAVDLRLHERHEEKLVEKGLNIFPFEE
jgi:hypothetical protein